MEGSYGQSTDGAGNGDPTAAAVAEKTKQLGKSFFGGESIAYWLARAGTDWQGKVVYICSCFRVEKEKE